MTGFDADWLESRRPIDFVSRAPIPEEFAGSLASRRTPLNITDLGAGTGSNAAFLRPHLMVPQEWRLVENDTALIEASDLPPGDLQKATWLDCDLSVNLDRALMRDRIDLITGSALLDLVSAPWVDDLVEIGTGMNAAFLFALTYDGVQTFKPILPDDVRIVSLFNRHQQTDKGFGPALGGGATAYFREQLAGAGYRVEIRASPWVIGPNNADFACRLLPGIGAAAREMAPEKEDIIVKWLAQRLDMAKAGRLTMTVGHYDLFAWREKSITR